MCKNVSGIQRFIETNIIDAGVPTIKQKGPVTISQMYEIELIRTIVWRLFNNHKWYKGEVTQFDLTNQLYYVKYQDGGIKDYEHKEMKKV